MSDELAMKLLTDIEEAEVGVMKAEREVAICAERLKERKETLAAAENYRTGLIRERTPSLFGGQE